MASLGHYAEVLNQQLIESNKPSDEIMRQQGRAQATVRIITALAEAPTKLAQMKQPQT